MTGIHQRKEKSDRRRSGRSDRKGIPHPLLSKLSVESCAPLSGGQLVEERACFQVLKKGSSGSSVKMIQQMLIACGYPCGSFGADGKFGNATYAALVTFQKAAGVIADGEYGSQTKSKLTEVYHKKMSSGVAALNNNSEWGGMVIADVLNVRSYAGVENPKIKSWPQLFRWNLVDVCDTVKAGDGKDWYYVRIDGNIYGFVCAEHIVKM